KAALSQSGVEGRGRVALGEDQAVPLRPGGVGGVYPHLPEVQKGQHLRDGQAAAGVAAFGAVGALDHAKADAAGVFLQGKFFCVCHRSSFHFALVRLPMGPCWGRVVLYIANRNAGDTLYSNLILSILPENVKTFLSKCTVRGNFMWHRHVFCEKCALCGPPGTKISPAETGEEDFYISR